MSENQKKSVYELPKMVTDDPKGNFEVMLNLIYGKDGWSYIRHGEKDMPITDFCLENFCRNHGCNVDSIIKSKDQQLKDEYIFDCNFVGCPVATVYAALSGYGHLRDRLRKHEDAMTNRVLTLEEVKNAEMDTFHNVMHWLELKQPEDSEIRYGVLGASMFLFDEKIEDDLDVIFTAAGMGEECRMKQKEYCKDWRCWLRKPTEAERREIPWEN